MRKEKVLLEDEKGAVTSKTLEELAALFEMEEVAPTWDPAKPCPFMVKKFPPPIGYGLKSLQDYKCGDIVIQYLGVLEEDNDDEESDAKNHYTIHAGEDEHGKKLIIDPEKRGGLARLISHAFFTSHYPEAVTANLLTANPQPGVVFLIATKDIPRGAPLVYNYSPLKEGESLWWEKRKKQGFSPLAFSATGEILGPALPPADKMDLFYWEELLAEHTALEKINNASGPLKISADISLSKLFPTYTWGINQKTGDFLILLPDEKMLASEQAFFRRTFSSDIQVGQCVIAASADSPRTFAITISGMTHQEYCRILRTKVEELRKPPSKTPAVSVASNRYSLPNDPRQPLIAKEEQDQSCCCSCAIL